MLLRLFLCLLLWPSLASAATLITESSFEGSGPEADGWLYTASYCTSSPCSYLDVSTDVAHSGSKSLKGTYNAAWSDPNPQINTVGIYKGITASTEVYVRYWYYTSGFTYASPSTKHIYYKGTPGAPNGVSVHGYGSRELGFAVQTSADCGYTACAFLTPNMASRPLADNTWYCIEEHFKLNTPGQANGMIELWVDGTQTLGSYNREFKGTAVSGTNGNSSNMVFDNLEIYKQNGHGSMYYDQFTAATTRIGCGSAPPPPKDTTPPSIPTSLTATNSGGGAVSLNWTATSASDLAGYTIRRCQGSCTPTAQLTTVNSSATSFVDTTVAPTTQYTYSINAFDTSGNQSDYTAGVPITTATTYRTILGTETFDRADSTELGANWDNGYTGHTNGAIVSNQFRGTVTNTSDPKSVEQYVGVATPDNQWCQVTLPTLAGSTDLEYGCAVRMANPPTIGWYWCYARKIAGTAPARNSAIVSHHPGGVGDANLVSDFVTVWGPGDKIRCEAEGTALRLIRIPAGQTAETTLLSTTDSEFTTGRTGLVVWMGTGGTLSNAAIDDFAMGGFSSSTVSAVAVDAVSNSASGNLTNTISWTHAVGAGANRLLAVCLYSRDDSSPTPVPVVSMTSNGLPLTLARADLLADVPGSVWMNTELWYLINPSPGTQTLTATWTGSLNRYGVGSAVSYTGVDQTVGLDAVAGATGTGTAMAASITTVAADAMIHDCALARGNPMTVGSGQVERVNRDTTTTADSLGISTVLDKVTPGVESMDWTQTNAQSWVVSAASFAPASVTPVSAPTIASVALSASGATLTYGATTPSSIRVVIGSNYSATTQTTVASIASFPGGVYTKTWPNGYDFVCFYPRDSLGAENLDASAYQCGSLSGIVDALDTTAIVMTQALPAGTLNQGTTGTTIALTIDKDGSCRYALTNIAYDSMTDNMVNASLLRSAAVTGLTNGTTTHYYVQCRFTNAIGTDITTSTALDIAVTVANSAPADSTAPSTVTNLVAVALSQSQVQLTWSAATDNVSVQGYQVYQDLTGACTTYSPVGVPVTATTVIENLPASTAVSYVVKAIDTSQNYSAADSNCATVTTAVAVDTTPPSTMTNLAVVAYKGSLVVTFDSGTDNGTTQPVPSIEYCVGAGCTTFTVATSGVGTTKYVTGLTEGNVVCVRGRFTDGSGNVSVAYSNVACATVQSTGLVLPRQPVSFSIPRTPRS